MLLKNSLAHQYRHGLKIILLTWFDFLRILSFPFDLHGQKMNPSAPHQHWLVACHQINGFLMHHSQHTSWCFRRTISNHQYRIMRIFNIIIDMMFYSTCIHHSSRRDDDTRFFHAIQSLGFIYICNISQSLKKPNGSGSFKIYWCKSKSKHSGCILKTSVALTAKGLST